MFLLQDFAKSKAIPHGEEQAVFFPPVWKWSQQFSPKDQTLFNNPLYVGKGAACVQNGEVKSFRRSKVLSGQNGSFSGHAHADVSCRPHKAGGRSVTMTTLDMEEGNAGVS